MTSPRARREAWQGYALLAPSLLLFGLVYLYPVVYSAYISLFQWDLITPRRYVALANYAELVSDEFREVVTNTVQYSAGVVVLAGTVWAILGSRGSGGQVPIEVTGAPRLKADRPRVDLGDIRLGRTVEVSFQLANVGDQPLALTEAPYVTVAEGC